MSQSESDLLIDKTIKASKLLTRGQRGEAMTIYHEVDSKADSNAQLQYHLGRLCEEFGDIDLAVNHFQQATEAAPDHVLYLSALGLAQYVAGDVEQSLTTLRQAEALDPANLDVLQGLGSYYLGTADYDRAVEYLETALSKKPSNAVIRSNLATALTHLNQHEQALEHARKAVKSDASNAHVVHRLCNTLAEMGQLDEAQSLLEKTVRKQPGFGQAYDLLARIRKFSSADDSFIRRAEQALDKGMPAVSRQHLLFALGKMHDDCQRYDEAFAWYRQANQLARKDFDFAAVGKGLKSIRSVFDAQTVRHYQSFANASAQPVFVVGMPRSGTTLIEQLIARHPRASGAGELSAMQHISDQIFPPDTPGPSAAQLRAHLTEDKVAEFASTYLRKLGNGLPDSDRIVDKAPMNFNHIGLIATLFPNATIIHAMRNPLDTCLSCYFQNFAELNWSNDFETLAQIYGFYRETMEYWRKTLPDLAIVDLPYESLVEDPEQQVRRLIEACGLAWDDRVMQQSPAQSIIKSASQAQARQAVYRSSRNRWQHYIGQVTDLASLLSPYLDDADRERLAGQGVKLRSNAGGGWLKRIFN